MNEEEKKYIYIFKKNPQEMLVDYLLDFAASEELSDQILKDIADTKREGFIAGLAVAAAMIGKEQIEWSGNNFFSCNQSCDQLQAANQAINSLKTQLKWAKGME